MTAAPAGLKVAILPLDNLSGGAAPLKELRRELAARLQEKGMTVLPDGVLDAFMLRHRLRYVGGIDAATAEAFRAETGVDAVAVTSLELYGESYPPRIAITARLVATGSAPRILRMESAAMAGDDTPGLFGLGLVTDPRVLREKAIARLVAELTDGEREPRADFGPATLFHPRSLDPEKRYSVAVIPFQNKSTRKYAGEILALHFVKELVKLGTLDVVEPGVVREELLRYRVIMEDGISLADAEIMFGMLKADLLLTGNVNDYEDQQGSFGSPKVDFSALLLDRESRLAVWAVDDRYTGDDRVHFFDFGRITTANALAAAMVHSAVGSLYH